MSFLWRARHSLLRARAPLLIPRGTRGVSGQFDHLPLPLPYSIDNGLGKFLPPPALEAVAMEYQLGLLARLTDEVRHTDEEGASVTQVVISTAPSREKTLAFNYASLALNNSFFLANLTPNPAQSSPSAISERLLRQLNTDHGGIEQFKSAFSAAALGVFTSGYIWFVTDKFGSTSILPTFGPGTLLVRSRTYMATHHPTLFVERMPVSPFEWDPEERYLGKYLAQWGVDGRGTVPPALDAKKMTQMLMTDPPPPSPPQQPTPTRGTGPSNGAGAGAGARTPLQPRFLHTSAPRLSGAATDFNARPSNVYDERPKHEAPDSASAALHAGETLYPLFCLSVHEHAWLSAGYGVWGKEAWLREFWSVLNWEQVSEAYEKYSATAAK